MALLHRFKFDGNLNNSVGTINGSGAEITYVEGPFGDYSVYLPSSPVAYVTLDGLDIAPYTNYTISLWVKSVVTAKQQLIQSYRTSAPDRRTGLYINTNNTIVYYAYNGTGWEGTPSSAYAISNWTHIVITSEGSGTNNTKIYINGNLWHTTSITRYTETNNRFTIGANRQALTTEKFNGYMDDFRFYDVALTADEALALYRSYETPKWDQPLHRWKLDGNALDSAGTKNGTAVNMTYSAASKIIGNYSGSFNGTNGYITANGVSPLSYTNFSISMWFKCSNGNRSFIVSDRNPYARIAIIMLNDSVIHYEVFVSDTEGLAINMSTTVNVADDRWHHYCITDANGTCNQYVDSKLSGSGSYTRYSATQTLFTIGAYITKDYLTGVAGYFMNGLLDDVRFYDYALSASEVKSLYNSYFTEKAAAMMQTIM